MDLNIDPQPSPMDLRVFQLMRMNKFVKKMDKTGMSCPLAYRKRQFRRMKPSSNFDTFTLALRQARERHIYREKNVTAFPHEEPGPLARRVATVPRAPRSVLQAKQGSREMSDLVAVKF